MEEKSILSKIIPFYGIIEDVVKTGTSILREKVHASEERKSLKTKAEIMTYLQTEHERISSEIRQQEANADVAREITRIEKMATLQDEAEERSYRRRQRLAESEHHRQMEMMEKEAEMADRAVARRIRFEQHRVELFERIKRLEISIKREIFEFQLDAQKRLMALYEELKEKLAEEHTQLLIEKLPEMLVIAQQFQDQQDIQQYKERIFQYVDRTVAAIERDQEMFRNQIAELHTQQSNMTASLIKISENFQLPYTNNPKMLENE